MKPHTITNENVQDKLEDKVISWIDQVSTFRQENGISQKELAMAILMDEGQLSKLMHSPGNITLATVVKFDLALGMETLVTPDDYEERLVDDTERFIAIAGAAMKAHPELQAKLAQCIQENEAVNIVVPNSGGASVRAHVDIQIPSFGAGYERPLTNLPARAGALNIPTKLNGNYTGARN